MIKNNLGDLWLIGTGSMSKHYTKVLQALNSDFEVIGRSNKGVENFFTDTLINARSGGVKSALSVFKAPEKAIIAVDIESLADVAISMIEAGTRHILLEKPGGLNTMEIRAVKQKAFECSAKVYIAYNRRFYASTQLARKLIANDGGAISCNFEFTEWPHVINKLSIASSVKKSWFLANSSHIADLTFHLCGFPKDWKAWQRGALDWHPSGARFCGSGITNQDTLFSYQADWEAPGCWGVEVMTRKNRFIFRPIEDLQVIKSASLITERIHLDDKLDREFKPGLYAQTKAFLDKDYEYLCDIEDQLEHCEVYDKVSGYN